MKTRTSLLLSTAMLLIAAVVISAMTGCTQADLDAALQKSQTALASTTQASAQAQATLDDLNQKLAVEKQVLTTQPTNTDALKTLDTLQKAEQTAEATVTKYSGVIAGLNQAAVNAQAGQTPSFGFLGAFGAYGDIAAILATVGWGAYERWQKTQAVNEAADTATQLQTTQAALVEVHSDTDTSVQPTVPFSAPTQTALMDAGVPAEQIAATPAAVVAKPAA